MSYTETLKEIILAPATIGKQLFAWLWNLLNSCTVPELILILIGAACLGFILDKLTKKILKKIELRFSKQKKVEN